MDPARWRIEERAYDDPEVVGLVAAVQQEYVVRYGGPDQAAVEVGEFAAPRGRFLLGLLDGEPVATGAWRSAGDGTVELKRMFVIDSARRRGLARLMLAALEASAAAAGKTRVILNTGLAQPEAIALYESSAYTQVASFGHYADAPRARFYGKTLVQPTE